VTDREVLDSLIKDACEQQAGAGRLPRSEATQRVIAPILASVEKKREANAGRPQPKPEPRAPKSAEVIEAEYKRRGGMGTNVQLVDVPKTKVRPVSATKAQKKADRMLKARIRLLASKEDWHARLKSVDVLAVQGMRGEAAKLAAREQYRRIIEDSDRVFGPWWKTKARKIYSSGSGSRHGVQG
jgi:hypothetical protein